MVLDRLCGRMLSFQCFPPDRIVAADDAMTKYVFNPMLQLFVLLIESSIILSTSQIKYHFGILYKLRLF